MISNKEHVSFRCPICQYGIRPHEKRVEVEGPSEKTLYYAHAQCVDDASVDKPDQSD